MTFMLVSSRFFVQAGHKTTLVKIVLLVQYS